MSDPVTVHVSETGASPFAVEIAVGAHRLTGDEPVSAGGGDLGPSPYEMLAAALGERTSMTVRWFARQRGWAVEHVAVEVAHRKERLAGEAEARDVFTKIVSIRAPDLDAATHARLFDVAARCPVHRTLSAGAVIETRAALSSPDGAAWGAVPSVGAGGP